MAKGMGRLIKWGAAAAVVLAGAGIAYTTLGRADAASGGFTIETATVERGSVARLVSAAGSVRALTTVEVGSQLSGQILELNADFNTQVEAGQIIARLDPETYETRVTSATADVTSAQANLAVQQVGVTRAQINLAQVERDYSRQSALYSQDAISQSTFEEAQRQLDIAQADLALAQAQVRSAEANLTQREAALQSAQVDLSRTIIRSPITGVVIERNVDVGQTVAASLSAPVLFQIAQDLSDIRIDAAVVEADIGGVDAGDKASFTVDAYPDQTFEGEVEQVRLASQETQNVVTYTAVIAARNPRGRLLPGMTANVEIIADQRDDVLRVSESAVRFRAPKTGPTVIDADQTGTGGRPSGAGGAPGGGGRAGPGGGFTGMITRMLSEVGIDEARRDAIATQVGQEMRAVRESFGDSAQFNRAQMRERMRAAMEKVLRAELTPDEYKAYEKAIAQQATRRRVDVYTPTAGGDLQTQSLLVGLSDGSYVEVLRGAEEGDAFVTRVRAASSGQSR